MKKGVWLLCILLLASLTFIAADEASDVKDGYDCLISKINSQNCMFPTTEQKAFSLLALDDNALCKSKLIADKKNDLCWGKTSSSSCDIKSTAQAILALFKAGENVSKQADWLYSQQMVPTGIDWFLQIESTEPVTCTVTPYDSSPITVSIGADKKILGNPSGCLSIASLGYWLKIDRTCYNKEFQISCDKSFLTNLLYKDGVSPTTVFVSSETHTAADNGKTFENIKSLCFKNGNDCDYEGGLWAAMILRVVDRSYNIGPFVPYLMAGSTKLENEKYLPASFLYSITADNDFYLQIIGHRKFMFNEYWDISGDKYYDTALAVYTLDQAISQKTKDWFRKVQTKSGADKGCWREGDAVRNTAFVLHSVWPDAAPVTSECSDSIDNDGDGKIDYSATSGVGDAGCSSTTDNDESNCGDGKCEGGETTASCPADCPVACIDADGDKYNVTSSNTLCGTVFDCNDGNILINPGASEQCGDGVNNDCSSATSDICPSACSSCTSTQVCYNNACCTPNTASTACGTKNCGTVKNNCNETVACGSLNGACLSGQVCNATGQCAVNQTTVIPICGDGKIDSSEDCDGANIQSTSCAFLFPESFTNGTASCYPAGNSKQCLINTTGCFNSTIHVECNSTKPCPTGQQCNLGTNRCIPINTTSLCGNGIVDPSEECDGALMQNRTCSYFTFDGGKLSCYPAGHSKACLFNTSACYKGSVECLITAECTKLYGAGWTCGSDNKCKNGTAQKPSCVSAGLFCRSVEGCRLDSGNEKPSYSCPGVHVCCDEDISTDNSCEGNTGEVCESTEICDDGYTIPADNLSSGQVCCIDGTCSDVGTGGSYTDCEWFVEGTCKSSCDSSTEDVVSQSCEDGSSNVCCVSKSSGGCTADADCNDGKICSSGRCTREPGGSYTWLWILLILIILAVTGIIFRERLRPLIMKLRSMLPGFKRDMPRRPGFPSLPGVMSQPMGSMPSRPMMSRPRPILPPQGARPIPQAPMTRVQRPQPPQPQTKPQAKEPPKKTEKPKSDKGGELDDVLKKLKEIGK